MTDVVVWPADVSDVVGSSILEAEVAFSSPAAVVEMGSTDSGASDSTLLTVEAEVVTWSSSPLTSEVGSVAELPEVVVCPSST